MNDSTFKKYCLVIDEWFINGWNGVQAYLKFYPNSKYESADSSFREILKYDCINEYINKKKSTINEENCFNYKKISFKGKGVYVIQCIGTTYFKIGKATNINNRLSAIQTGCPFELRIVKYIKTEKHGQLEEYLHKIYEDKIVRGEWFHLNRKDLDNIHKLKKYVENTHKINLLDFNIN